MTSTAKPAVRGTPHAVPVGVVGSDVPRQLLFASGAVPVTIRGSWEGTTSHGARELLGALDAVTHRMLTELLAPLDAPPRLAGLIICNDSAAHLRLFYVARILSQRGRLPYPVHLLDCPRGGGPHRARFMDHQFHSLTEFLTKLTGHHPNLESLTTAGETELELGGLLAQVRKRRRAGTLTGTTALNTYHQVSSGSQQQALATVREVLASEQSLEAPPSSECTRVYVTGSTHPDDTAYRLFESSGYQVVGEDHATGDSAWLGSAALGNTVAEVRHGLIEQFMARPPLSARSFSRERAEYLAREVAATGAECVWCLVRELDDAPLWDIAEQRAVLADSRVPLHVETRIGPTGLRSAVQNIITTSATMKESK